MIRAQGVVTSKPDPLAPLSRDIYVVLDGPYMPIFEDALDGMESRFGSQFRRHKSIKNFQHLRCV